MATERLILRFIVQMAHRARNGGFAEVQMEAFSLHSLARRRINPFKAITPATVKPMSHFGDRQTEIGLSSVRKIFHSLLFHLAQTAICPLREITTVMAN